METGSVVFVIAVLLIIVFQDFKSREISWFLIPLLAIGFWLKALQQMNWNELIIYTGVNLLMVFVNLLCVAVIISIRQRKWTNIINTYLGLGDILFFAVLTVAFSPFNFVLFYLGSISIISLYYGIEVIRKRNTRLLIPLAGAMSLLLILVLIGELLPSTYNCYTDILALQ